MKLVYFIVLLVTSSCHLTSENLIPTAVSSLLRTNVQKVCSNLDNFGSTSASLSLIKFYLTNVNRCIDSILKIQSGVAGVLSASSGAYSNNLIIAN
jgi:hypothetical protein